MNEKAKNVAINAAFIVVGHDKKMCYTYDIHVCQPLLTPVTEHYKPPILLTGYKMR